MSGRLGNVGYANTEYGVVVRSLPAGGAEPTLARLRLRWAMKDANRVWQELSAEEAEAWQAYARGLRKRNPQTGLETVPKGVHTFTGLAVKYLQLHGGRDVPKTPPVGAFLGDTVDVLLGSDPTGLLFTAGSANRAGVTTELLAQRLWGKNNRPKQNGYVSLGFVEFEQPGQVYRVGRNVGTYAAAYRFVEVATGRSTVPVEIGRATVTDWS